jgi:hypothetical protein
VRSCALFHANVSLVINPLLQSLISSERQSTAANRQEQLAFLEGALKTATAASGWTVLLAHHPAFSGDESYFSVDEMGTPESTAWAKVMNNRGPRYLTFNKQMGQRCPGESGEADG